MSSGYTPAVDNTATQHDGTETLAVNVLMRRLLTLVALKTVGRFYRDGSACVRLSSRLVVKTSPWVHLTEAATLQFVAKHTSVPVPRVHCAFVRKNRAFIVMDRVLGVSLARAWKTLTDAERDTIFAQLRTLLQELRALPPPPGARIQSCVGGSMRDPRLPKSLPRFGPFKTTHEFHSWLRDGLQPENHPDRKDDQDWKDIKAMVARQDGPWPPPVFAHGDLNPSNIFVHNGRVSALIDWECAGWYPPYWDYTSAWYWAIMAPEWQDAAGKFLDPCPDELAMEITRRKWWGE
ncbi:serine threonine kinase [Staphylotrichum tortipilum]|uniref:Serine threonine kinase n=1 Tax=Staphylotrichum tortipilum TaxID=2831512 RepID=A0AAN6RR40_9PEZI|nr:serine threonine kinase [Staphylotrichum longicolle]